MKNFKYFFCFLLIVLALADVSAQQFRYGVNFALSNGTYTFPVEGDRFHKAKFKNINSKTVGASVQFTTKSFRFGSGVRFMSVTGEGNGGYIKWTGQNPNGTGESMVDVNNTYLVLPVDFQIVFMQKSRFRPLLSAGVNFFKPLKKDLHIWIDPDQMNEFYEEVRIDVDKDIRSAYFGFEVGTGVVTAFDKHEVGLSLTRNFNKARYTIANNPNGGDFEKHEVNLNSWEVCLFYTFAKILE
jgi:hypothetical protein